MTSVHENTKMSGPPAPSEKLTVRSQKPLRYLTDDVLKNRQLNWGPGESMDINSELRPEITNLNYYEERNTELFGTAPYRGIGRSANKVNDESILRFGDYHQLCDKQVTEREFAQPNKVNIQLIDSQLRPSSTRNDNKYIINPKK
jgi:hypothetical protein